MIIFDMGTPAALISLTAVPVFGEDDLIKS
jgi:hypothetical protein